MMKSMGLEYVLSSKSRSLPYRCCSGRRRTYVAKYHQYHWLPIWWVQLHDVDLTLVEVHNLKKSVFNFDPLPKGSGHFHELRPNGLCVNTWAPQPFRGSPWRHFSYEFEHDDNDSTKKRQFLHVARSETRVEPRKHAFFWRLRWMNFYTCDIFRSILFSLTQLLCKIHGWPDPRHIPCSRWNGTLE